jgi:tetratricopeptide (TPR) repeat protein
MEAQGEPRARVAVRFRELAEEWPAFEHADQCLYRSGLLHRDEGQVDEAISAWSAIEERYPESGYVRDAELESIRLLESAGERARAADRLERFAERHPEDPESAGALLQAAELWEQEGDRDEVERIQLLYLDRNPEDRETELAFLGPMVQRALERVGPERPLAVVLNEDEVIRRYLGAAQARPDLAEGGILARIDFLRAEEERDRHDALALAGPLDKAIASKRRSLEALVSAYRACMTRAVPPWNYAAAYRIGETLAAFGTALENVEPPSELAGDDAEAYRGVLADEAWTFYDQAEEVWSELLRGTRSAGVDGNDWIDRARRALWARLPLRFLHLAAVDYPVVPAEAPEAQ